MLYARHCLFLYDGGPDNLYLLNNWNEVLWFLPAIFLSYLLFWVLYKASARRRIFLVIVYVGVSIGCCLLPILLPWSLDTVFITSIVMALGYGLQRKGERIEAFQIKKLKNPRTFIAVFLLGISYLLVSYVGVGINTSVRQWGRLGAASIFTYIAIGLLGIVIYLLLFSALEKERWGRPIVRLFSFLGKRTVTLLATHVMFYRLLDRAFFPEIFAGCSYGMSLVMVMTALCGGLLLNVLFSRLGRKIAIFKLL